MVKGLGMRAFATALLVTATTSLAAPAMAQEQVYDPWEETNRDLYAVHDSLDRALLEPAAKGYRAVTNRPIRSGVRNFLRNLRGPVIFVNDVLQAEPSRAGTTAARFGLNTTIGVLGIFDPASSMGLERHDEDFGQTLAVWGVPDGPYLFIPLAGPSNVRDSLGGIVDIAFQPLTWAEFDGDDTLNTSRFVLGALSGREGVIEAVEDIRATSLDPYVTYRVTFGTLRANAIRNGAPNVDSYETGADDFEYNDEDYSWTQEPAEQTGETADESVTSVTDEPAEMLNEELNGADQ